MLETGVKTGGKPERDYDPVARGVSLGYRLLHYFRNWSEGPAGLKPKAEFLLDSGTQKDRRVKQCKEE
jgi:hypothetical protein